MKMTLLPDGQVYDMLKDETVLHAFVRHRIALEADCGGKGTCGKCKVKLVSGELSDMSDSEAKRLTEKEKAEGVRLACYAKAVSEALVIDVSAGTRRLAKSNKTAATLPEGFALDHPLQSAAHPAFGMAFDIGTTTVVGILWDLRTGQSVSAASRQNPQGIHGSDVISRIQFCESQERVDIMKQLIRDCLNDITDELTQNGGADVYDITVVCNTTMSHLFMGVDPSGLAVSPFEPVFYGPITGKAALFNLHANEAANFCLLPNIAGHLGSDIVAVILATELGKLKGVNIAIDVGTNGEIALAKDGRLFACSTAAGPAFEGAAILQGMRGTEGAIERVEITDEAIKISVIGDVTPVGICGSGLVDVVSELLRVGVLNVKGKFMTREKAEAAGIPAHICDRLQAAEQGACFVLYENDLGERVIVTQKDIRELQLAKGAILAGINILLGQLGLSPSDIDSILLAGAFGNYINKFSALGIGLFPPVAPERVISVGNAAGSGASLALLSRARREKALDIAKTAAHVALAEQPDFQNQFIGSLTFPQR